MPLEGASAKMDAVLNALYDSNRAGGLGSSSPNINRWLGDIRTYFPTSVVQVMQKDALDRLGLTRMLLEPELLELIEPDVHLVATLLSLKQVMPDKTKASARQVIEQIVEALKKKLQQPLQEAISGSLRRNGRKRNPRAGEINWHQTIRTNLRHYQPQYKTIIPSTLIGYQRKTRQLKHIILLVDQSASMGTSVVYAGILGSVIASMPAVKTHMVVFDTKVVDLTAELSDPVELLFATQLGGGTDIHKAVSYANQLIEQPAETILVILSDLFEGGSETQLLQKITRIKMEGTQVIALLALNDEGTPAYDKEIAQQFGALDIPAFACTPDQFPGLMASAIAKQDLNQWMARNQISRKN